MRPTGPLMIVSAICAVCLAAVLSYPAITSDTFVTDIATDMVLWATLAIGLNAVLGWAGLLDLGYIAFFAIGGYVYAILSSKDILQFWPGLIAGVVVSAIAALIIGFPSLRLQSDYLAIMTLGFGEIVYIAAKNLTGLTGGNNGLYEYTQPSIGTFQLDSSGAYYGMALVLLAIAAAVSAAVRRSRLGRSWMTLRDDELAARSFGVSVWRAKLMAYMYGSVWGTLAGAVFAAKQTIVSPTSFAFDQSFYALAAVVIGGMGSVWGAAIGGIVYVFISEALQGVSAGLSGVIFGCLMLLVILIRPQGLVPTVAVRNLFRRLAQRPVRGTRRALSSGLGPPPSQQPTTSTGGDRGADASAGTTETRGASDTGREAVASSISVRYDTELIASNIHVRYGGVNAVDGVSLTCRSGEVLVLIGSNGAGKTSLLNALSGLARLDGGTISFRRPDSTVDLTSLTPAKRAKSGLARAFQTPRLSRNESVSENVRRGTLALTRARSVHATGVADALDLVGLTRLANMQAGELSYGDQRRCEIARTLVGAPDFLLLDEPSSGMNDVETAALGDLLTQIARRGPGIILVEHDMNLVRHIADRVIAMDMGRTLVVGAPNEVLSNSDVRSRYLGEESE